MRISDWSSDVCSSDLHADIYVEEQAYADPEAFVQRRLAEKRAPNGSAREQRLPSGEWHLLRPRTTPSGMPVTRRVDITEQKRLQQELAETSERLRTVSEATSPFLPGPIRRESWRERGSPE